MNNELIETKRIGPFILGKFVDENNDIIFAKISIRDPYPNGCQCKNSFLSLKDCYICIHTCILYSNLNKLDITARIRKCTVATFFSNFKTKRA